MEKKQFKGVIKLDVRLIFPLADKAIIVVTY
jgi:hypothetical protein